MEWMSTIGVRIGKPSKIVSETTDSLPSTTKLTSKLVPPISTHIKLGSPSCLLSTLEPTLAPTGPDIKARRPLDSLSFESISPPFDCIMKTFLSNPFSFSAPTSCTRYFLSIGDT